MIECPDCGGQGGQDVYCDECLSTGAITVTGPVAEVIDDLRAALAATLARAEAAEAKLAKALKVGELWQCPDCHKICTQAEGADDEWQDLCDDCWAKATAEQQSETRP